MDQEGGSKNRPAGGTGWGGRLSQSCLLSGRDGKREGLLKLEMPGSEAGGLGPGGSDRERTPDRRVWTLGWSKRLYSLNR